MVDFINILDNSAFGWTALSVNLNVGFLKLNKRWEVKAFSSPLRKEGEDHECWANLCIYEKTRLARAGFHNFSRPATA